MKIPEHFNYFYENYFENYLENFKVLVLIHIINRFNSQDAQLPQPYKIKNSWSSRSFL
jgi:hypothetical protein